MRAGICETTPNVAVMTSGDAPVATAHSLSQALDCGGREVQLQTWCDHLAIGRQLAAIDGRVVVKTPITRDGVEAAAALKAEGRRVTLTGQAPASKSHAVRNI